MYHIHRGPVECCQFIASKVAFVIIIRAESAIFPCSINKRRLDVCPLAWIPDSRIFTELSLSGEAGGVRKYHSLPKLLNAAQCMEGDAFFILFLRLFLLLSLLTDTPPETVNTNQKICH